MRFTVCLSMLLLLGLGCATARPHAPAFFCEPEPFPPTTPPKRVVDGPIGKLELTVLEPRLTPPPSDAKESQDGQSFWFQGQKLRVIADSTPLQSVAFALSSTLGIEVDLEPAIAPVRVVLYQPATTLSEFLRSLETMNGLHVEYLNSGVIVRSQEGWWDYVAANNKLEPTKVRLLWMKGRFSAEQLAAIYCHQLATNRGSATAVEDLLIVTDTLDGLARVQGLKDRIENPGAFPPPVPTDPEEQKNGR